MKNPLKRGKEKFQCEQDKQTGAVHCQSFREHEDGTREALAEEQFEFTGDCQGVATQMSENEPGALER
ncbi:MAG: hypothetical protein KKB31_05755, partial [Nanoarchaeota archaeon]|nr:hypothetical protein [Nanoarchaeota archaeon]